MRSKKLRPKPVMPGGSSSPPGSGASTASDGGSVGPGDGDSIEPSEADLSGPATAPLKASGLQQMGSAIGGIIAGIENQVFGRPPPGPVLIRHAVPSGGKGPDGTKFTIDFPDDAPGPPPPTITGSTRTGG